MGEQIILKKNPRIEFQLLDSGFELIDEQTEHNSGFYAYSDLQAIELEKIWFPRLAKYLRAFSWFLNGVPLFPDANSYKKAKLIFHFTNSKLGMWVTDSYMVDNAKKLKDFLDHKS